MIKKLFCIYGVYCFCTKFNKVTSATAQAISHVAKRELSRIKNKEILKLYDQGYEIEEIYAIGDGEYCVERIENVISRYEKLKGTNSSVRA